uniref:Uncharacterized protein n=1 Tax=Arion vulgaris TaxID=1028688 RepID=A0A0B7A0Q3_9EUPU
MNVTFDFVLKQHHQLSHMLLVSGTGFTAVFPCAATTRYIGLNVSCREQAIMVRPLANWEGDMCL